MVTFTTFSNILPDPVNKIGPAGDLTSSGSPGPGFSAVNFQSVTDTQVSRTISGRGVQRDGGSQHWEFSISYNPMFRSQFDPVDSFLSARNPRKQPFYVVLPQYSKPKDPVYAAAVIANPPTVVGGYNPGASAILITNVAASAGKPSSGDMINISDTNDYNHQKTYKVTRVETNAYYQAGTIQPSTTQYRIHISPPLQRAVTSGSTVVFTNPKFRVITKSDVQDYSLGTDNLYKFDLALEEIMP